MPTDPNYDRKHTQAKPAHPVQKKKNPAQQQKSSAVLSRASGQPQRDEYRGEKRVKHAQSGKSGYAAKTESYASRETDARKKTAHAAKKPARESYDARYAAPAMPKKKKKKFKLKRFFKKIGRELQAFGAKLVEVEEHPVMEPGLEANLAVNDLGFSQNKPVFDAGRSKGAKPGDSSATLTAASVLDRVKKALRSAGTEIVRHWWTPIMNSWPAISP